MPYATAHQATLRGFPQAGLRGRSGATMLGTAPQASVRPFRGPRTTLDAMAKAILGPRGEQSMRVRQFTEWVVRDVWPKDYLGEILAIRNCFVQPSPSPQRWGSPLWRYTNDPLHVELVKDPERVIDEVAEHGSALVDCDDTVVIAATMCLQVGRVVELVALGFATGELSHVGLRAMEPKSNTFIWLDGVAGPREAEAAGRAKEVLVMSLD